MDDCKTIADALHAARGALTYHTQSNQERQPIETIEELKRILESTAVTEALNHLRGDR